MPGCCRHDHDLSDAVGTVKYEEERGQLVLQLIAAYAVADWPLTLYLSDGLIYHRVILNGKHLAHWQDLTPREALYYMMTDLEKVGARPSPLPMMHVMLPRARIIRHAQVFVTHSSAACL